MLEKTEDGKMLTGGSEQTKPLAWQYRARPADKEKWLEWGLCSEAVYKNFKARPNLYGWVYETRVLVVEADHSETVQQLRREIVELKAALLKINDIRNSIIGFQKVSWSEHVYPLVGALDAAGIKGLGYQEARDKCQTILDELAAAKQQLAEAEKNAARYRWLKARYKTDGFDDEAIDRERAIDNAIAAVLDAQATPEEKQS